MSYNDTVVQYRLLNDSSEAVRLTETNPFNARLANDTANFMPFEPITVGSKTFTRTIEGKYLLTPIVYNAPTQFITVKGATLNRDRTLVSGTISNTLEKDVTEGGTVTRRKQVVRVTIESAPGFTAAEADAQLNEISAAFDEGKLNRFLAGES